MTESIPGKIVVKFSSDAPLWRREFLFRSVEGREVPTESEDNSYVLAVLVGSEDAAILRLKESAFVLYAERLTIDRVVMPQAP